MNRCPDFKRHAWRWLGGPVLLYFAFLVWRQFVHGVNLLQQGEVAMGAFESVISAVTGGMHVSLLRAWFRDFSIPRKKPLMIPDSILADVYEHFARAAVAEFNTRGLVPPHFFAVVLDPADGSVRNLIDIPDEFSARFYRDAAAKDTVRGFVRFLLSEKSPFRTILAAADFPVPDLVVQISEAWMAEEIRPLGETIDLNAPMTPPSERPDRREGILTCVHSLNHTVAGYCPIHAAPRRAEYQALQGLKELTGRMSMNPPPSEDASVTKH